MSEEKQTIEVGDLVSHVTNPGQLMLVVDVHTGRAAEHGDIRCEWVSNAGLHSERMHSQRLVLRQKHNADSSPGFAAIVTG